MSTEQFVAALTEYRLDPTEIAEVLWLALHQPQTEAVDTSESVAGDDDSTDAEDVATDAVDNESDSDNPPAQTDNESENEDTSYELAPELPSGTLPERALPISVPDPDFLDETLPLVRAMKPLLKQIESQLLSYVNEVATVERIAETDIWSPVLDPELEPWFDVALVIDSSPAMSIWQRLIRDIQRLLRCYGSFRDFRVWQLVVTDGKAGICATSSPESVVQSAEALLTPDARRLVLVFSDCTARYWWDGSLQPTLQMWGRSTPTAIWQVLPDWMWKRTALGRGEYVAVRNHIPGADNSKLTPVFLSLRSAARRRRQPLESVATSESAEPVAAPICVPVVTSQGKSLEAWSRMLAGDRRASTPGFLLPVEMSVDDSQSAPSEEDVLDTFRLRATPSARRLAALLSAAPVITLPVMRLIRASDDFLPGSSPLPVAEVFLGGLLKKVPNQPSDANAERVQYVLAEGVRDRLLDILPKVDAIEVIEAVSGYVARQLNCTLADFRALLLSPDLKDEADRYGLRSFATMTAQILRKAGLEPEFADLVRQLEGGQEPQDSNSESEASDADWLTGFTHATLTYQVAEYLNFPLLESFPFEQCELDEDESFPPPLSTEEFAIQTLVRSPDLPNDADPDSIRNVYTELLQQYENEQSGSLREHIMSALSRRFEDIEIWAEAAPSFGRHEQDEVIARVNGFTFESPIEITNFSQEALVGSSTLAVDVELEFTFSFYRYDREDREEMQMENGTASSDASIGVSIDINFVSSLEEREIEIDWIDVEITSLPTIDLGEIAPDWIE